MIIFDPKKGLQWTFPSKMVQNLQFKCKGQSQWEFMIVCDTFTHAQHNNVKKAKGLTAQK